MDVLILTERDLIEEIQKAAQQGVPPRESAYALRAVRQFLWLEVSSVKAALPRPAHLQLTRAVGRHGGETLQREGKLSTQRLTSDTRRM
jgi:hypothetical protein